MKGLTAIILILLMLVPTFLGLSDTFTSAQTGDSYEPDNSFTQFSSFTVTTTLQSQSRSISPAGDYDYVRFYATTPGTYTFYSTGSTDTYGYLYNSASTQVASNDDGGGSYQFRISYTITSTTTGYYYIVVKGFSTATTGAYVLYGSYTPTTTPTTPAPTTPGPTAAPTFQLPTIQPSPINQVPYSVSATPLATSNNEAFFKISITTSNDFSSFYYVGPVLISTNNGVKVQRMFALDNPDLYSSVTGSIVIGAATAAIPGPGWLSFAISVGLDVGTQFINYYNTNQNSNVNQVKISPTAGQKTIDYLVWLESATPITNWGTIGTNPSTTITFSYQRTTGQSMTVSSVMLYFP
jgi:hypothetical protein